MYSILGKGYQYSGNKTMDVLHQVAQQGFRTAGVEEMTMDEKDEKSIINRTLLKLKPINPYHFMTKLNFEPTKKLKRINKFFTNCEFLQEVSVNYEYLLNREAKIYKYSRKLEKLRAVVNLDPRKLHIDRNEMFNLSDNFELELKGDAFSDSNNFEIYFDIESSVCENFTLTLPEQDGSQSRNKEIHIHVSNFGNFKTFTINANKNYIVLNGPNLDISSLIINDSRGTFLKSGKTEYFYSNEICSGLNKLKAQIYVVPYSTDVSPNGITYFTDPNFFRNAPIRGVDGFLFLLDKKTVEELRYDLDRDVIAFDDVNMTILHKRLGDHNVTFISKISDLFLLNKNDI